MCPRRCRADTLRRRRPLRGIADWHDHLGPGAGEPAREAEAEAVARAGDDDELSSQVGNGDIGCRAWYGALLFCSMRRQVGFRQYSFAESGTEPGVILYAAEETGQDVSNLSGRPAG